MGLVDELADQYTVEAMALDPVAATYVGVAGHDDQLTDLSTEAFTQRADLNRRTLAALARVEPSTERERVAKETMQERLGVAVELFDSGQPLSNVNVIDSALHELRGVFDVMPTEGEAAAHAIAARLAALPAALAQWRQTLRTAAETGNVAASQQILEVADCCARWSDPARDDFFPRLAERVAAGVGDSLAADLRRAAAKAAEATAHTGRFLRLELAQRGRANQAVGRDRYQLASRYFLGSTVDLDDAYAWGFTELDRILGQMRAAAAEIVPEERGHPGVVTAAIAALESDPDRMIKGSEPFRQWMQDLADQTIAELSAYHFDIPQELARIECMIAPTRGEGIYYIGPSEDFSRPGRMWWSMPDGHDSFTTWREVTTVYHEGVPGHHLQIGAAMAASDNLNRWQRLLCWCSGHAEGWALYAERLMDELGYFGDPGDRLGMLEAQAFRAARVIVDIGMHLELAIPGDNPLNFHPNERWTPALGCEFMRNYSGLSEDMLRFELNRYLGWPGQAPSYKLGERIWLSAREAAMTRRGNDFDLRSFHRSALTLGGLGLDPLVAALSRL